VQISPLGRAALRSSEPLSQFGGSSHTTYDNSNNVTVGPQAQVAALQAGGHGNIQVVEQVIGQSLRSELAERLADLIKQAVELPDDTPGALQVREDLDEIRKEIAMPDAKPGVLKSLGYKALGAFAAAAATSGGEHLVKALAQFVKMLESKPPS
jgi:hypothetical protein